MTFAYSFMVAFFDILVFFGIVLVGFAYLWKRGDIDWVRAMQDEFAEQQAEKASQSAS